MLPKVYVIILNFNRPGDTLECLESVRKSDYPNYKILVVDNASTDNSYELIQSNFPDLPILRNKENLGYAEGNNVGIRWALKEGCDYVFILNNDVVVKEDAMRKLVEAGEKFREATILAPKIYFYDKPRVINSCGTNINWFRLRPNLGSCGREDTGRFNKTEERRIFPGSALLLKKILFKEVGFFNEKFYLIYEDAELCLRNVRKNFKNLLVPEAVIYHKVSKTLASFPFEMSYYSSRNFLYLSKNCGTLKDRIATRLGLFILLFLNLWRFLFSNSEGREKLAGFFRGVLDYYQNRMGRLGGRTMTRPRRYLFKKRWKRMAVSIFDGVGAILFFIFSFWNKSLPLNPQKILVVRIDSLGDGVLTLPAIQVLKKRFPEAQIDFLTNRAVGELYACLFPSATFHLFEDNWRAIVRKLGASRYDLGIDFRGDVRTLALLVLAGIPHRWGRDGTGGGFLLTRRLKNPYEKHEMLENLELVSGEPSSVVASSEGMKQSDVMCHPEAAKRLKDLRSFASLRMTSGKKIVIHVGAGYPSKQWAASNFIEVAKRIQARGLGTPVFIGSANERVLLDPYRLELGKDFLDLTGQTSLSELLTLLSQADLYIGNDSGPAHLAALLDRKIVLIFSGTNDFKRWAPWSSRLRLVRHPVPCSPCEERICPLSRQICLEDISVEEVFGAVEKALSD